MDGYLRPTTHRLEATDLYSMPNSADEPAYNELINKDDHAYEYAHYGLQSSSMTGEHVYSGDSVLTDGTTTTTTATTDDNEMQHEYQIASGGRPTNAYYARPILRAYDAPQDSANHRAGANGGMKYVRYDLPQDATASPSVHHEYSDVQRHDSQSDAPALPSRPSKTGFYESALTEASTDDHYYTDPNSSATEQDYMEPVMQLNNDYMNASHGRIVDLGSEASGTIKYEKPVAGSRTQSLYAPITDDDEVCFEAAYVSLIHHSFPLQMFAGFNIAESRTEDSDASAITSATAAGRGNWFVLIMMSEGTSVAHLLLDAGVSSGIQRTT